MRVGGASRARFGDAADFPIFLACDVICLLRVMSRSRSRVAPVVWLGIAAGFAVAVFFAR